MRIEDVYINERLKIDTSRKIDKSTSNGSNDKAGNRLVELISIVLNRMRA